MMKTFKQFSESLGNPIKTFRDFIEDVYGPHVAAIALGTAEQYFRGYFDVSGQAEDFLDSSHGGEVAETLVELLDKKFKRGFDDDDNPVTLVQELSGDEIEEIFSDALSLMEVTHPRELINTIRRWSEQGAEADSTQGNQHEDI